MKQSFFVAKLRPDRPPPHSIIPFFTSSPHTLFLTYFVNRPFLTAHRPRHARLQLLYNATMPHSPPPHSITPFSASSLPPHSVTPFSTLDTFHRDRHPHPYAPPHPLPHSTLLTPPLPRPDRPSPPTFCLHTAKLRPPSPHFPHSHPPPLPRPTPYF